MSLVPYISRRPGVSMAEIAAEYDIDVSQVEADLNLLMVCGTPGYYPDDLIDVVLEEDGSSVSIGNQAGLDRPVRLTGDEAVALTAALRALADLPGLVDDGAVTSALAKLEAAGGGVAAPIRVAAGDAAPALATVRQALESGRRLSMRYYTASRDALTDRVVDPLRLVLTDGHTYVEAFCHTAGAVRNFRVDRIDAATVLDEPAQAALWVETSVPDQMFHLDPEMPTVRLRLAPSARWIADYYLATDQREVPGPEGTEWEVTMSAGSEDWLVRLVLSHGGTVRFVDRDDLTAAVRDRAHAALAGYPTVDEPGESR